MTDSVNHPDRPRGKPGFVRAYLFSTDHKTIGIQFLFLSLAFFTIGGALAMLMRWQLAYPDDPTRPVPILGHLMAWNHGNMPSDFYNIILTMHATIMIFFVVIPLLVGAFGNYLIPLQIGARDMAFPFLNGLAFWGTVPAGAIMLSGFFLVGGGAAAGWTSYPPLSAIAIENTSWPLLPMVMTGAAFFMFYAYIGVSCRARTADHDFGGPRCGPYRSTLIVIAIALIASLFTVRGVQHIAFDGQACWFLSLLLLGSFSVLGAINYIATIVALRCPGMTMFRMPLTIWSMFITAILVLLATPVLAGDLLLNLLDHHRLTSFFEPAGWNVSGVMQANSGGGVVLLHLHLFWFYSHPAVYIMILPAMGMVSDILPVFARKPIFGYRPMIAATAAIAFLGFLVWGHHMFQSGMNPALGTTFALSTMVIAVPSGVKVFNWLATLWGGDIRLTVPMCNALAFVSMFVIGGLSGIFMASTAVDVHLHMTYFIVAHIHYVLFGASTFGIFAGIYFWYPKMFGRMLNAKLGYVHFTLSFIAFNLTFLPMHFLGLQGMPRRISDYNNYTSLLHLAGMNKFISHSAFLLGIAQIIFAANFLGSLAWGKKAPANPWNANTLEWNESPDPVVQRGPYEYSSPLVDEDWLAQTRILKA